MSDEPSKRSIVFVHGSLDMGGAEVLRLSVLEELVKHPGLELRVCVLRQAGLLAERVQELGIPLDVLNNRGGLFDLAGVLRLARYLRQHRPQVAQSSQFLTNLQTRLAGWLAGTPAVIIEEHGVYLWKRWYHRLIDRWVNRRAQAVIACSNCVAQSAAGHLGMNPSDIVVLHNCAAQQHFQPCQSDRDSLRNDFGATPATFVVGVIGTLRWEKGHSFLLRAWQQLRISGAIGGEAQLWIVGSGPLERQLREQAASIDGVVFLGRRTDTQRVLNSLDAFVLPSVNEGFGIAIVEAMCAGLPIISTHCGGIPEVIDTGRTGILVQARDATALANAIADLHNDAALRQRLGAAARSEAEQRFAPDVYARRLIDLYAGLGVGGDD
ncbi:MAG: glycosyltransferase family 4 protein [Pirellulales bacterium]|nr:glycosyltransferase family 4 protein [Pirellulales bacterium]